jgi:uncharacterized protein YegL
MVLGLTAFVGNAQAEEPTPPVAAPDCTIEYNKTASPDQVQTGGLVTVTLEVKSKGSCDPSSSPVDIMLVIDRSGSMSGSRINSAKSAAKTFVDQMNLSADQAGVASFTSRNRGTLDHELSQDGSAVKSEIDVLRAGGATDIQDGLEIAATELQSTRHISSNAQAIILLSDGVHNASSLSSLLSTADSIKADGIRIITIGLGYYANEQHLKAIASSDTDYYFSPNTSDLADIYNNQIAKTMRWAARRMVITDNIPNNIKLVPNSFQGPYQPTVNGNQLVWDIGTVNTAETITLSYQIVMPDTAGEWDTNASATAKYVDTEGDDSTITFPVPQVQVGEACGAPVLQDVLPEWVCVDQSASLDMMGASFYETPLVTIGGQSLTSVSKTSEQTLTGQLAAGLSVGMHDAAIVNQCPASGTTTGTNALSASLSSALYVAPKPKILSIRADEGYTDIPNNITICGEGFTPIFGSGTDVTITCGGTTTALENVATYGDTCLSATVPENLTEGMCEITVKNQCGTATGDYRVLPTSLNNDLWGQEPWVSPSYCVKESESIEIGLFVHRRGGKDPLQNVKVRFYEDQVDDAHLIGEGTVPMLSPRVNPDERIKGTSTTAVPWTPSDGVREYEIIAVIDPENAIDEDIEDNNESRRTVQILPGDSTYDGVAPHVDDFEIESNGSSPIYDRNITVHVKASDAAQSGATPSGVYALNLVEMIYSESADIWVPVGWTDWVTYSETYNYELAPPSGLRYIQAWVSDESGNVSRYPYQDRINYAQMCAFVGRNAANTYRENVEQGETVYAELVSCRNDPDLYIWPPDWDDEENPRPPWVSNLEGDETEVLTFTAPISGVYVVEVYGYNSAKYNLQVETYPSTAMSAMLAHMGEAPSYTAGVSANKDALTQPFLPASSVPEITAGIAPPPVNTSSATPVLFLPTIMK